MTALGIAIVTLHKCSNIDYQKIKGTPYTVCVTNVTESKISFILFYDQPFSRHRPLYGKCTESPKNGLEHYKINGTLCMS